MVTGRTHPPQSLDGCAISERMGDVARSAVAPVRSGTFAERDRDLREVRQVFSGRGLLPNHATDETR